MTESLRVVIVAALLGLTACQPAPFLSQYARIDLLIENGRVIDGTGGEAFVADIAVVGDRIVFVGDASFTDEGLATRVARRIDASGKTVTPGFIDLHSHGDPLETPAMENFLAMGVTTISLGQDGSSPDVAPLSDWLDEVAAMGIGTNLVMFVGHGTLRNQTGIGRGKSPNASDMIRMLESLDDTLSYTFGLSTGLEYNPGLNADRDELRALAKVVGRNDRMIMSHLRNEDDDQLENSIAELLEQGEYARVHISHLKSVYGKGSGRAEEILAILDAARDGGIEITADTYPYSASYTGIGIVFPVWAKTRDEFDVAKAERREELAEYLRNRIERRNGPEATLLGTDPYTGKTLADLAHEMELPFEDVLIDVIGPDGASGAYFVMNDELQTRLLADPFVDVCSDGSPTGFHPRGHGTFARIIEKHVVHDKDLTLPEAIRKLTSFPAGILRIEDRGLIREGMFADLLVFDPLNVRENATYPDPHQLTEGFDVVIVNGKISRESGKLAADLSGRVLRPENSVGAQYSLRRAAPDIIATNAFYYYDDVDAAWRFYRDALGLETVVDYGFAKILRLAESSYLTVVDAKEGMHSADEPKVVTLQLVTDELNRWHEHFLVLAADIEYDDGGDELANSFIVRDPEGYTLRFVRYNPHPDHNSFVQPFADASPVPGQFGNGKHKSIRATAFTVYYDKPGDIRPFFEGLFGIESVGTLDGVPLYQLSGSGFLSFDYQTGPTLPAPGKNGVTLSFFTNDVDAWFDRASGWPGFELRTPEVLSESGLVRVFVGYDPAGTFLEWDTFLDLQENRELLQYLDEL